MAAPKKKIGRGIGDLIKSSAQKSAVKNAFKKEKSAPETKKKQTSKNAPEAKKTAVPATKKNVVPATKISKKQRAKVVPEKKIETKKVVPAEKKSVVPTEKNVVPAAAPASPFRQIPISQIEPSPNQSRKNFDATALAELADSIRSEGLLQPLVVRQISPTKFQLIAGERRLRACKEIGLKTIEVRVVEASDVSGATMTLIENLQRENLDPIEEAFGIGCLMRDFNLTQEAVAERLGKARSSIANSIRLLSLEREIQNLVSSKKLSAGHAKVLLSVPEGPDRLLLSRRFVESECSVRDAEILAKKVREGKIFEPGKEQPVIREVSQEIFKIEKNLCSHLHTKVIVKHGKNFGKIIIEYHGNDDLARLLEIFGM